MAIRVKLSEIIDGMQIQSDENSSFLNKATGEVVLISDYEMRAAQENDPIDEFPEWERDQVRTAREILAGTGDYIELPTKFDIDEYAIMERFCLSLADPKTSNIFCDLIQGGGAFRRFKEAIHEYDLTDDWYRYRDDALKEIAIDWCRENNIEYDDE